MSMQIATNIGAINAQRNLSNTTLRMGKVLEKLSSGFRINRAADDAAGLAISEKMRAQIRGSQQAIRNAKDGISMLQTAEGALDEVHAILQRMRELSVQAANGTYANNGPERTSMGEELIQLRDEINRIAQATEFNGQKLLSGDLGGIGTITTAVDPTSGVQAGATLDHGVSIAEVDVEGADPGATYTLSYDAGAGQLTMTNSDTGQAQVIAIEETLDGDTLNFDQLGVSIVLDGDTANQGETDDVMAALEALDLVTEPAIPTTLDAENSTLVVGAEVGDAEVSSVSVGNAAPDSTFTLSYTGTAGTDGELTLTNQDTGQSQMIVIDEPADLPLNFDELGVVIDLDNMPAAAGDIDDVMNDLAGLTLATGEAESFITEASLHIGANTSLADNTLTLNFEAMSAEGIGLDAGLFSDEFNVVSNPDSARSVIDAVDEAIDKVNSHRGSFGAAQNRLEHTIRGLSVAVENLSAAESRIRDADIAELSSELVSQQILQQAGVSVLSQANTTPQAALQLLQ